MRKASDKQVRWALRLIEQAGRTPTPELEARLRAMSDADIRVVTARAQAQRDAGRSKKSRAQVRRISERAAEPVEPSPDSKRWAAYLANPPYAPAHIPF